MAQSAVDVSNNALQRVGAARITSLTDATPEARACSLAFDATRRSALRRYPWNFAIKRAQPAPDTETPLFDFDYQFTLPADCLRVLRPNTPSLDWKIEGNKLLTNDGNTIDLRYVADIEDVAAWDSAFYEVFAAALALRLRERLTQSNAKMGPLKDEYKDAVSEARRADAFESGPDEPPEDDWLMARY